MSERVLPTEPGVWYGRFAGDLHESIFRIVRMQVGIYYVWGRKGYPEDICDDDIEWLEPVAPLGTAARLAAAEAELMALKERIAAAPLRQVYEGMQVRLLEVRDGDSPGA